jgi:hypothetical protein
VLKVQADKTHHPFFIIDYQNAAVTKTFIHA